MDEDTSIQFNDSFCNLFYVEFGHYISIVGSYSHTGKRVGESSLSLDLTEHVDEHTKSTIDTWVQSLFDIQNLERVLKLLIRRTTRPNETAVNFLPSIYDCR